MVAINLLPWQTQQIDPQRRKIFFAFGSSLLTIILIVMIIVVWMMYEESALSRQIQSNQTRLSRMQVPRVNAQFSNQQRNIDYNRQVIANLARASAFKVCISALQFTASKVVFQGQAPSSAMLTAFLQNAAIASLFPEIQVIRLEELTTGGISFECHGFKSAVAA